MPGNSRTQPRTPDGLWSRPELTVAVCVVDSDIANQSAFISREQKSSVLFTLLLSKMSFSRLAERP